MTCLLNVQLNSEHCLAQLLPCLNNEDRYCLCRIEELKTVDFFLLKYTLHDRFDLLLLLPSLDLQFQGKPIDGIFKIIFLSCVSNILNKLPGHLSSLSNLPAFRKHNISIYLASPFSPDLYHGRVKSGRVAEEPIVKLGREHYAINMAGLGSGQNYFVLQLLYCYQRSGISLQFFFKFVNFLISYRCSGSLCLHQCAAVCRNCR